MALPARRSAGRVDWIDAWPLLAGIALLAIPTFISLGGQSWSTEAGAHGPIILCTGLWLLWRQSAELRRRARLGNAALVALVMAGSLAVYVFGRAYDFISLEVAGVYGVCVALFYARLGWRLTRANWFPLLYLGFVIPPPGWAIDSVTAPLKRFVSYVVAEGLHAVGLPVLREGVTLIVAQYQLLVEDACSGMNSIIGLMAISLFYIYMLRGASWRYAAVLAALVVPIAIAANIIRVTILVLLTYFFGDAVAQGFLHSAAGIVLFATALLLVFAVDAVIARVRGRREQAA